MGSLRDNLSWYSVFVYLFGAILGFADPITDILTLRTYYQADRKTWFGVGLAFVVLPCLVFPFFYVASHWARNDGLKHGSHCERALCIILFGLNPFSAAVARLRCCIFCLKNCKKICKNAKAEWGEDTDDLLGHGESAVLVEALLESTPQFIIQLYAITVQQEQVQVIQMISLPLSLLSLAWASTNADGWFHSQTAARETKHKVLLFVTHLFLLSSRLFAIAMFAVTFKWWIIGVLSLHSIVVITFDIVWIVWSCRRDDCYADIGWCIALYSIFLFCVYWMRDDMTTRRFVVDSPTENVRQLWNTQLLSHLLFIGENVAMILYCYLVSNLSDSWYALPVTIGVCLFSALGSAARVTHFYFLHRIGKVLLQEVEQ